MIARTSSRVGIFVTAAFVRPKYLDTVSGHVQIALKCADILSDAGYRVTLITTKAPGATELPYGCLEKLDVRVVQHATRSWPSHRVYMGKAVVKMLQLLTLLKRNRFDIVHFFGGTGTGQLLGILKAMGVPSTAVYSPIQAPRVHRTRLRNRLTHRPFRRIHRVLTTAEYVSSGWMPMVGASNVRTLRPGIMKQFPSPRSTAHKNSVLFWRDARHRNGADIVIKSFRKLAPKYPDTRFVCAVRPHDTYEADFLKLGQEMKNVDVHIYPYRSGVSLASLLREAIFVVEPFRRLSVNPQMCILETLYAGVPVVTTDIESNGEVIHHEQNGLLIPPDDEPCLSSAIERLLGDPCLLAELTRNARPLAERRWNWDVFGEVLLRAYGELQ